LPFSWPFQTNFYDTDPGFGKGVHLSMSTDADGSFRFAAPTSGLLTGYHLFGLRAYQVDGKGITHYAPTITQQIFVPASNGEEKIVRVEYLCACTHG
jgi:hypothetical protein